MIYRYGCSECTKAGVCGEGARPCPFNHGIEKCYKLIQLTWYHVTIMEKYTIQMRRITKNLSAVYFSPNIRYNTAVQNLAAGMGETLRRWTSVPLRRSVGFILSDLVITKVRRVWRQDSRV